MPNQIRHTATPVDRTAGGSFGEEERPESARNQNYNVPDGRVSLFLVELTRDSAARRCPPRPTRNSLNGIGYTTACRRSPGFDEVESSAACPGATRGCADQVNSLLHQLRVWGGQRNPLTVRFVCCNGPTRVYSSVPRTFEHEEIHPRPAPTSAVGLDRRWMRRTITSWACCSLTRRRRS